MYVSAYHAGLGDTAGSSSGFDWSFLGGSVLTAGVLGIGLMVAMATVLKPYPRGKKWADGAWRSRDYEERSRDFGVRPERKRGRGRS